MIDKRLIAESFSRAAASYDAAARLQRLVGDALLQRVPSGFDPGRVLDLGCGTGYFTRALAARYPAAEVYGLDLAWGMLAYAQRQGEGNLHWVGGDAETLPLADGSIDLLFSSLAIQWCADLPALFQELRRVLRPGGRMVFSTLVDGTLWELRQAWQAVDQYRHVNDFVHLSDLQQAIAGAGFSEVQVEQQALVLEHDDLRDLTSELKRLGAHNLNEGRPQGMTGRQRLRGLRDAYETLRTPAGTLPATWQVVYGGLQA